MMVPTMILNEDVECHNLVVETIISWASRLCNIVNFGLFEIYGERPKI